MECNLWFLPAKAAVLAVYLQTGVGTANLPE